MVVGGIWAIESRCGKAALSVIGKFQVDIGILERKPCSQVSDP